MCIGSLATSHHSRCLWTEPVKASYAGTFQPCAHEIKSQWRTRTSKPKLVDLSSLDSDAILQEQGGCCRAAPAQVGQMLELLATACQVCEASIHAPRNQTHISANVTQIRYMPVFALGLKSYGPTILSQRDPVEISVFKEIAQAPASDGPPLPSRCSSRSWLSTPSLARKQRRRSVYN